MSKGKKTLLALTFGLILPAFTRAEPLKLNKGTMQLGGDVTFNTLMVIPETGDSETGFTFSFSPAGGYFLMDKLELIGMLGIVLPFGDLYQHASKSVMLSVGAQYYIDIDPFCIHFGALIGMGFSIPDEGDTTKALGIAVPVGILFPFNAHVALDVGLQIGYTMGLDSQGSSLSIPVGYVGVQSFF